MAIWFYLGNCCKLAHTQIHQPQGTISYIHAGNFVSTTPTTFNSVAIVCLDTIQGSTGSFDPEREAFPFLVSVSAGGLGTAGRVLLHKNYFTTEVVKRV